MIKKMFCIYDTQAKMFAPPFFQATIGEAIRAFGDAVNDQQMGSLYKHPADFLLYEVGTFDDTSGELVSVIPPIRHGMGSDFKLAGNGKVVV